jgi:hypothetical protein
MSRSYPTSVREDTNTYADDDVESLIDRLEADDNETRVADLSCRSFSPESLKRLGKALARNTQCHTLDMRHCALWSFDVSLFASFLSTNSSIQVMDLSHNRITSEGAQFLASMLPVNDTLITLNLSDNSIGDGGMAFLLQAVLANASLEEMLVGFNPFTKAYVTNDIHAKTRANAASGQHHSRTTTSTSANARSNTRTVNLVDTIHSGRMFPKTRRTRRSRRKKATSNQAGGGTTTGSSIVDGTASECGFSMVSLSSTASWVGGGGPPSQQGRAVDEWSTVDSEDWRSITDSADDFERVAFPGENYDHGHGAMSEEEEEEEEEKVTAAADGTGAGAAGAACQSDGELVDESVVAAGDFELVEGNNGVVVDRVVCA